MLRESLFNQINLEDSHCIFSVNQNITNILVINKEKLNYFVLVVIVFPLLTNH